MENICLNCIDPITENFCSNYGQKKYKSTDRKYLIDELQYSVIHSTKGFFYSIKNSIKNPGKTAKEFIDGNYSLQTYRISIHTKRYLGFYNL